MTFAHAVSAPVWAFGVEPGSTLVAAAVAAGYATAIRLLGPRHAPRRGHPVSRGQVACFAAGVVALAAALGWPIHQLGEDYLFSVHMVQHLLISLIAAPLLLLGTPGWLLRWLLGDGARLSVARRLTRAFPAFVLFNAMLVLSHWPAVVGLSLRREVFHAAMKHGFIEATPRLL